MYEHIPDNPYLLLTPGPLSTSKGVRNALLQDWCTWDADYNVEIVQNIRRRLVSFATAGTAAYTSVLMQGSGSFAVEAAIGSAVPKDGKLLIITNGAYGVRMVEMARALKINHITMSFSETRALDAEIVESIFPQDPAITHVAFVHCETTTGILNPIEPLADAVKGAGKVLVVDAMSSFGGIPFDIGALKIDFLISSSNKCIQGVPGFGFVVARKTALKGCEGNARSLCFDLYGQWKDMDASGKWRYTSPTHVVHAFYEALNELEDEGGVATRYARYCENQSILVNGMRALGFRTLLPDELQSPIITSFLYPSADFDFRVFYNAMKTRGFVLYPGKISQADTFRIGNIGEVYPEDIRRLLAAIREVVSAPMLQR